MIRLVYSNGTVVASIDDVTEPPTRFTDVDDAEQVLNQALSDFVEAAMFLNLGFKVATFPTE